MPRIFGNAEPSLLPAPEGALKILHRAAFCVGYFNLRDWRQIACLINEWPGGDGSFYCLFIGMQSLPHDQLREALSLLSGRDGPRPDSRFLR